MFQVGSHKAAHHQHQKIQHLQYENQLLKQRNQLLANENFRLLEQVEKCHAKLLEQDVLKANKVMKEYLNVQQMSKQQLLKIRKGFGRQARNIIDYTLGALQNDDTAESNFTNLFDGLISLIKHLSSEYSSMKKQKLKSNLSERQQRLTSRRIAKEKTQRVLHVIKEPNQSLYNWNPKQIFQELNHQRQFFQKIIKKVQRNQIPLLKLQHIYNNIDQCNQLRWALKSQQVELTLHERQFQLGSIEPATLQQVISKISQISEELSLKRKQIEDKINAL